MRDQILYSASAGFLIGIFIRSFIWLSPFVLYLSLAISAAFFILYFLRLDKRSSILLLFAIFISGLLLGTARLDLAVRKENSLELSQYVGENFSGTGIVVDEPDERARNTKLTLEIGSSRSDLGDSRGPTSSRREKILVTADAYSDFKYGDEVNISGKLVKPENFTTDQGKVFDYVNYLGKDDIYFLMPFARISLVSARHGSWIKSKLFTLREKVLANFARAIPEPESTLLGGLVLGTKQAFSPEMRNDFIKTGTIHIIALSGMNVTILALALLSFFSMFTKKKFAAPLGIVSIILFVVMTGGQSSALRAGIMGVISMFALLSERKYNIRRALLLALLFMVAINPKILAFDISFQLSFLATVGIVYFSPIFERWLVKIKNSYFRKLISATISAQLLTLPLIIYKMGILSIVGLPVNVLILPLVEPAMIAGIIIAVVGLIYFPLSALLAYPLYLTLHFLLKTIIWSASLPFSAKVIPSFSIFLTILFYFLIFIFYLKYKQKELLQTVHTHKVQ